MLNSTFPFAGSFVELQNTNFVCLLHLQTRGVYSSRLCRYAVKPFIGTCCGNLLSDQEFYIQVYRYVELTGSVGRLV